MKSKLSLIAIALVVVLAAVGIILVAPQALSVTSISCNGETIDMQYTLAGEKACMQDTIQECKDGKTGWEGTATFTVITPSGQSITQNSISSRAANGQYLSCGQAGTLVNAAGTPVMNVVSSLNPIPNEQSIGTSYKVKVVVNPAHPTAATPSNNYFYMFATSTCPLPGGSNPTGCQYHSPDCPTGQWCSDNKCYDLTTYGDPVESGCLYNNPTCAVGFVCNENSCIKPIDLPIAPCKYLGERAKDYVAANCTNGGTVKLDINNCQVPVCNDQAPTGTGVCNFLPADIDNYIVKSCNLGGHVELDADGCQIPICNDQAYLDAKQKTFDNAAAVTQITTDAAVCAGTDTPVTVTVKNVGLNDGIFIVGLNFLTGNMDSISSDPIQLKVGQSAETTFTVKMPTEEVTMDALLFDENMNNILGRYEGKIPYVAKCSDASTNKSKTNYDLGLGMTEKIIIGGAALTLAIVLGVVLLKRRK